MNSIALGALALLAVPLVILLIDGIPQLRARGRQVLTVDDNVTNHDFAVLVPIWGSTRYLQNVDYLAEYGDKVVLCTTTGESPDFYLDLMELADRHGFRVVRADVPRQPQASSGRTVSGTIRDRVIRAGAWAVDSQYVVAIDADTVTERPLAELVGALQANGLDVASVRILPVNTDTLLGRLQAVEYSMSMRLRKLWPWLVSGACHAATTAAYREIMDRHSTFFQGNDAEVGILGELLGYRVGHVDFVVPTEVPSTVQSWWRQRVAWAGGEFRLAFVNVRLARWFPSFFLYLTVFVMLMVPLRWTGLVGIGWLSVAVVLATYVLLVSLLEGRMTMTALVYPVYALVGSLILVLISPFSYIRMAIQDRNSGLIRLRADEARQPLGKDADLLQPNALA